METEDYILDSQKIVGSFTDKITWKQHFQT